MAHQDGNQSVLNIIDACREDLDQIQQLRSNLEHVFAAIQSLCSARAQRPALDARVAIYSVNFGEASRHLENARGLLGRADERLKSLGRDDEVRQVQTALASIDDAQRMAGKLDQGANSRAGEAAKMLADVLDAEAKR